MSILDAMTREQLREQWARLAEIERAQRARVEQRRLDQEKQERELSA